MQHESRNTDFNRQKSKIITQGKLAEILGVSTEAVSKWEQDKYVPSPDKLKLMDEKIGLSLYEDDGSIRNVRLYDEDHMSAFLKGKMNAGSFPEASRALTFAKEKHAGSYRSPREARIPYINHPLTMACHAFAMGLEEDVIMAAIFLHDVVEDCHVRADELPVSSEIQRIVALASKPPKALCFTYCGEKRKTILHEILRHRRCARLLYGIT